MIETDAVVVGAGPVGLFQVFELGLQEVRAHVVDALPYPGGQCVELYGDKPIYDIPAIDVCTGRELTARLLKQIEPFRAPLHLGQPVSRLARRPDGRFDLGAGELHFVARVVIIAAGAGAFLPRSPKLEGLERHAGTQLHYHPPPERSFAGQRVVVLGGDSAAVEAALRLAEGAGAAASVALVHRRDHFQAPEDALARLAALRTAGRVTVVAGQPARLEEAGGRLAALVVTDADDAEHRLPLDALIVCLGLSPKLGPLAGWGLALERKQLVVDAVRFETSEPGIHAVGDIVAYPGKRKLIVCGFHEATLAAFAAAERVHPERPVQLQYTTTSTRLHALLGVGG